MRKSIIFPALALASMLATILSFAFEADALMFPMLMTTEVFAALWLFRPSAGSSIGEKTAFRSIIAFGSVSILMSYALSILVPIYGASWGIESHPDDASGILYPLVNDGTENCLFGSIVFIIYFALSGVARLRSKATATAE